MRAADIYNKNEKAGVLCQLNDGSFEFGYSEDWLQEKKPAISLTLPVNQRVFRSEYLFPFFYNLLPEGTNKQTVCFQLRIDESDYFGILMATAKYDTIGAIRVKKITNHG